MVNDSAFEAIKHENAKELEQIKWRFKKEELSYCEAGLHLRSLNQQLWQVPSMVIAITGGIWYGAASISGDLPKVLALSFAAAVNILTIPIIVRLRQLIKKHINHQLLFNHQQDSKGNYTVITCWTLLLITAACFSIASASASNIKKINTENKKAEPYTVINYIHFQKTEVQSK
ncbi:hypothetical protein [Pseudomonas syringae]|uniref:hypothetical protein n=1 Tax=Pseudomonas syringae TaxID=317 RepID=UPI000730AD64|nr:hypothetical protein [Pseudomonas syringae]KTC04007.1 hypothetical protein AO386_17105 [Pseudomonas syringae ICMP 11292]